MIKFSIITCTYNSAKFIEANIDSIKNQTYKNFEHIFIDGFSTDDTLSIIKKYQAEFPNNVRVYSLKPHGISNAMNEGIRQSTGDYFIHLHSDDSFYNNNVLQDVSSFLDKNNYDWIYGQSMIREENGDVVGLYPKRKILQYNSDNILGKYFLKFYNYIPHQTVFIKRNILDNYGYFDETLSSAMDPDLWIRIRNKTYWSYIPKIICNYCLRSGAQSTNLKNKEKNKENYKIVQNRYLNLTERFIAIIINFILEKRNKNYR